MRKEMFIGWQAPPWPWCKLNTDGSCRNSGDAGADGVIRDSVRNWILYEYWGVLGAYG